MASPMISFRVNEQTRHWLSRMAMERGVSVSQLVRYALTLIDDESPDDSVITKPVRL